MKETVRLGLYLLAVCALAGAALSVTYQGTSGRIRSQREKREKDALRGALPAASRFEFRDGRVLGLDDDHIFVGDILKVTAAGYAGPIQAWVGIDTSFLVSRMVIVAQNETPGLGSKIASFEFISQFFGKTADSLRLRRDGGSIEAVTAATISSRAVTEAIREKVNAHQKSNR